MINLSLQGDYTKVSSDRTHFYFVGDTGLNIVNRKTHSSEGFISFSGGFSSVWAKDDIFVYLGSPTSGLYFFEKPVIFKAGQDLTSKLAKDHRSTQLQSLNILSINGLNRNYFAVGTDVGVELITTPSGIFYSNFYTDVECVTIHPETFDLYYGGAFGLAFKRGIVTSNWSSSDEIMQSPFLPDTHVQDVDLIVEGNDTMVGAATYNGVVFIRQRDPIIFSPTTKLYVGGT